MSYITNSWPCPFAGKIHVNNFSQMFLTVLIKLLCDRNKKRILCLPARIKDKKKKQIQTFFA